MKKIGFIGTGAMGSALIAAVCKKLDPKSVMAYDINKESLQRMVEHHGVVAAKDCAELVKESEFVMIGIKPHAITKLLEGLMDDLKAKEGRTVMCSMAAGYELKDFDALFAAHGLADLPVIRIMPNSGVSIGKGATLFAENEFTAKEEVAELMDIFSESGLCEHVEEEILSVAVPIFSCSPAFVYIFIESLADAGSQLGLERDQAMRLATQAVYGTAANVIETGKHVAVLREELATPKAMTITATNYMEQLGFRASIIGGALKAYEHSKEMV